MAVDLAAQPTAMNHSGNYYNPYATAQPQQHSTPNTSGLVTPLNFSPTSPRGPNNVSSPTSAAAMPHLPFQTRQLRPPKCPLYVPAALRPTERPAPLAAGGRSASKESGLTLNDQTAGGQHHHAQAQGPPTPPSSAGNSYDDITAPTEQQQQQQQLHLQDAFEAQPATPSGDMAWKMLGAGTGITRLVTDEWNGEAVEDVTGAPTRDHWKPDSSTATCDFPACPVAFSLLNRRHHCRRCGQIFCASHSAFAVPLDQHARFHRQGYRTRACGSCWKDFRAWEVMMGKVRPGDVHGRGSGSSSGSTTPVTIRGTAARVHEQAAGNETEGLATPPSSASNQSAKPAKESGAAKTGKGRVEMLVGSITRDWNWSTF